MKLLVSLSFFLKIRISCTLVKGFLKFHHSCSSKFGWKNDVTSLNEHDNQSKSFMHDEDDALHFDEFSFNEF